MPSIKRNPYQLARVIGAALPWIASAAVGVMPATAMAQATEASQRRYTLDIPAQPLEAALVRFADVTGTQLIYSADVARGLSSPGVRGEFTAAEGIARLLAGTGLGYRFTASGAITIEAAATVDGARVLGSVRVQGAQDGAYGRAGQAAGVNGINGSHDITATEATGSFTSGALTIGSKAPRAMKDTPQSVSVITSERLEQQNINDFTQALQQAPGVTLVQGTTSLQTTFYSRGFPITNIQIDGGAPLSTRFADFSNVAYFPQIDLSQYDHVEVLRGAAGLFNGYGDPSGTINLVRKKPLDHGQVTLDAELGSWNHYRTVLDATAPLALDGKLRGRVVLTWQKNEHFYDVAEDQKTLLYGVLEYDLTPTTLVTAGASHTNQDSVPWYGGLPRFQTGEDLRLPRSTSIAFPWNRWDFDTTELFGAAEQRIGQEWTAKLNVTYNKQASTRKIGYYTSGAVNPLDNRGPRLTGLYEDYASDQFSAEATLAGAFTIFGQRQEITLGVNRSYQDGGGYVGYDPLVPSSPDQPYQPYPGGPRFCFSTSTSNPCPTGTIAPATPPINVFAFDPNDPLYTDPANPLPNRIFSERGQVQTLAYANLRLTAFDRLHLETGIRWSHYELNLAEDELCTSIPTGGTPSDFNCVGREIGDTYNPYRRSYTGKQLSWPPSLALSYDVTDNLVGYVGYTDIFLDQSRFVDGDLRPLDPITGENIELGVKWSARGGRLNASLSGYRIKKRGFSQQEPDWLDRVRLNPDGSFYFDAEGNFYIIADDGTELPNGYVDVYRECCYIQRDDQTLTSEGFDAELTGEILAGWQIAASYTYSQTKQQGEYYFPENRGRPFLSIQPKHLYKLWTGYDFGLAGVTGWLSNLTLSAGLNGQSKGYSSGYACPGGQVGQPNPFTGIAPCLVDEVPYEFTVAPYTVVSGRIDYRLSEQWSAALNLENIFDKTYYQSVSGVEGGNWYGSPRRFTLSLRGRW